MSHTSALSVLCEVLPDDFTKDLMVEDAAHRLGAGRKPIFRSLKTEDLIKYIPDNVADIVRKQSCNLKIVGMSFDTKIILEFSEIYNDGSGQLFQKVKCFILNTFYAETEAPMRIMQLTKHAAKALGLKVCLAPKRTK